MRCAILLFAVVSGLAADRPFVIRIVDSQTGRGVPLVELRTVNQRAWYSDSNGIVSATVSSDWEGVMRFLLLLSILSISGVAAFGQASQSKEAETPLTYSFSGDEMYKTWCASCHGTQGKGDGPAAAALKKPPADLTQLAKKNGGKFPTEKVRNYIDGTKEVAAHGSREMPVWGSFFRRLGQDNVTYRVVTLANYVASLQAK